MIKLKTCSKCRNEKEETDFYRCLGKIRGECKKCTSKRNTLYQKKNEYWKRRYVDGDSARSYQREYYAKNKEKFAAYRAEFKLRYPDYYKEYFRKQKERK